MKDEELIKKWLVDELSADEASDFKQSEEYPKFTKIWDGLSVATPPKIEVEEELQRLKQSRKLRKAKVVHVSWHKRFIGIAASLLIVSFIGYFLFESFTSADFKTLSDSQSILYLPDSSTIVLNKGSELTYSDEDWKSSRKVMLKGEGFFKVKSGSTFDVITSRGTVTVLGTSFNVKQRENFYEVICFEGKVKVEAADNYSVLTAGKGVRLTDLKLIAFDIDTTEQPDWLTGKSSFYKTPFYAVLDELENQYDITIVTENIALERTFTGSFPNDDITTALEAVTIPSGYSYQIESNKVLIKSEDI